MKLEYVPLLKVQRELYQLPRGWERFQAYLQTMVDAETHDMKLPLVGMNPMGKEHIPALLDEYLAFDADAVAAEAVAGASDKLTQIPGEFKVTLILSDDAMGGWTNRYTSEFSQRCGSKPYVKRGWLAGTLWTSEMPSVERVREEALTTIYRGAYIQEHGYAVTLGEILIQEGYAMAMAGCKEPSNDAEEIDYTREVIAPYLDTKDYPTIVTCLFGDEAARSLGYAPFGLSLRAGFALALHDARNELAKGMAQ
jgi:hypothetical protein